MGKRRNLLARTRDRVARSLPPPVPPDGVEFTESGAPDRQMPSDPAPEGFDPAKWDLMNRSQRREAKREHTKEADRG